MMSDPAASAPASREKPQADELPPAEALLAQREQQLAALRACHADWRRAFSHDLRAPVRHITSYAPLLREALHDADSGLQGVAAQEAQQFLGVMEQAAHRLSGMLDGTLRVALVMDRPPRLQRVDLVQLAEEVRAALLAAPSHPPPVPASPVAVVQWFLPPTPVLLQADPALLRQLLKALLENAHKFSRGQQPAQITLSAEPLPGGGLRWQVQDNGAGCDGTRAGQAFGLFQRLHREDEFAGLGVGLALAHAVACQHGAELTLHSAPGQGCTLVVDWPAAPLGD